MVGDRVTSWCTFDLVQYNWTLDALDQVYAQGVTPAEVHQALTGSGRRMIQPVNGTTLRVIARTTAGRLIEVWLRESVDSGFEVWTAFEIGMVGQAQWKNAFGDGE
jgi:hypothetical protein